MDDEQLRALMDTSAGLQALQIAFVVLVKMQPEEFRRQFIEVYQQEAAALQELASATANPDIWIETVGERAARLVKLIAK